MKNHTVYVAVFWNLIVYPNCLVKVAVEEYTSAVALGHDQTCTTADKLLLRYSFD